MAVSDSPASARVGRRRDAGLVAVGVVVVAAIATGATVAGVVLSDVATVLPSGERGHVDVERPFDDVQLPTL